MLAPTYQTYKLVTSEPFEKNGKLYVTIEHPTTHNHRDARWYTEAEYNKQYGNKVTKSVANNWNMKHARGFDKGPILVIRNSKGSTYFKNEELQWLKQSIARYAVGIGWHFISTDILPTDLPVTFKFVLLSFDEFRIDDTHFKSSEDLLKIIKDKVKKGEYINVVA